MSFVLGPSDPFYQFMQPPPDETPAQATARRTRELDAQRTSDEIDEALRREHSIRAKKDRNVVKILLLGQSESGKSTTLKNFRMRYAKKEWDEERDGWKAVIHLNIIQSIATILRALEAEMNGETQSEDEPGSSAAASAPTPSPFPFTDKHKLLFIKLTPLLHVEAELKRRLGANDDPVSSALMTATPFDTPDNENVQRKEVSDFYVRSWKTVLEPDARASLPRSSSSNLAIGTLAGCKEDMKSLWKDKVVRDIIKKRRIRLYDSASFFLDDLERIASRDYVVTDTDVMRARLRTVGIQEHHIVFNRGGPGAWDITNTSFSGTSRWEWKIYDVGGCRTKRRAWVPYFEEVNVILFLAPVSVFDEFLEEDARVNRLQDSLILWTSICSTKILAKTQLIMFLNKCDLLQKKLKRIRFTDFVPSFGQRPNTTEEVVKHLKGNFRDIMKQCSPLPRSTHIWPTTVTDTESTARTLEAVRDGVLKDNLLASNLI
ncbi:heterotrimeric G protein alpha subunit [Coprinopsis sp. MPI-PUGE-AT-0042]|nr:heterotrimeric G protein alpha subunit [Coprinopsis sp. MPI-PUGE-AT-0042]